MLITNFDKNVILNRVNDIPPYSWLKDDFTADQLNFWKSEKFVYGILHEEMTSFFSGHAFDLENRLKSISPIEHYPQIEDFTRAIKAQRAYYVELYTLLREGWYSFKTCLEVAKNNNKFNLKYKITLETILRCNTPGELLAVCIEDDCRKSFKQCTQYTEYHPRQTRSLILEGQKIYELMQKPSPSKSEKRKITTFLNKVNKLAPNTSKIPSICVEACEVYLKNHNDPTVRNHVRTYKSKIRGLMTAQSGLLHPDKHQRGFKWQNGQFLNLSSN